MADVKRQFTMSYVELVSFANMLCQNLTTDLALFADYGVTAPKIAALQALSDAFEAFPSDQTFVYQMMIATEDKNAKRDELIKLIKSFAVRFAAVFGFDSPRYKGLKTSNIGLQTDLNVLATARFVAQEAESSLAQLASEGVTQAMVDNFVAEANEFEQLMYAQKSAKMLRSVKTDERATKGNEIYSLIVKYCSYGKQIFEAGTANYEKYVITDSYVPHTPPQAPETLFYQNGELSYSESDGASSYKVERNPTPTDENAWIIVYEGDETEVAVGQIGDGMRMRVWARNDAGFSVNPSYSVYSVVFLNVPGNFHFSAGTLYWDAVDWANGYEFESSLNQTEWQVLSNQNVLEYTPVPGTGMVYYRVRALYGNVHSDYAAVIGIDWGNVVNG